MQPLTIRRFASVSLTVTALLLTGVSSVVLAQSPTQQASAVVGGKTLDDRSRAELLAAREQVWRAWFANDSVQLERLLPRDQFIAAGSDSVWQTRDQTLAGSKAFARSGGRLVSIEFPRTEMQVFGDVVVIYTTFRYTTERAGEQHRAAGNAVEVGVDLGIPGRGALLVGAHHVVDGHGAGVDCVGDRPRRPLPQRARVAHPRVSTTGGTRNDVASFSGACASTTSRSRQASGCGASSRGGAKRS